jgi:protein-S-isoprenylcysteine O-methyltransferase Ste14
MLMPGWSREETTVPALIAHSHFHLAVFYAALFGCFAPEWYGSLFHRVERGANIRDRGSHLALLATVSAGIIAAFGFVFGSPATAIAWHQHVLFWIGIAVMLAGLVFRWYAIHSLGRFFTRTVATRAGQYVVDSGPYRLIRHPSYTGGLLMFLGTGVAMTNWAALLAIMAGAVVGYWYRVRIEERALCADLGQPYRDYMLRTKRFIPHVL